MEPIPWAALKMRDAFLKTQYLYGILDSGYVKEENYNSVVRQLAEGGVKLIQFRAKGLPEEFVLRKSRELSPLCKELGVLFIINDYPVVAAETKAAGVHIGQDDGSLREVRKALGEQAIIGRSTHSYEQAIAAWREGADYIGFGPLFPTATKPGRPAIGLEEIARVHRDLPDDFPIYCIGGVQPGNLPEIMEAGARRVVIVSWLLGQENIASAARGIRSLLEKKG